MNPLVITPKKLSIVASDGSVWFCPTCQYTKPRFENDRLVEMNKKGIFCVCGTKMATRLGATVGRPLAPGS